MYGKEDRLREREQIRSSVFSKASTSGTSLNSQQHSDVFIANNGGGKRDLGKVNSFADCVSPMKQQPDVMTGDVKIVHG